MIKFFFFPVSCCLLLASSYAQPVIQWQNTIGGDSTEHLLSIQQTVDGGYILGGFSMSNISGDKTENCLGAGDYWVVKLDSSGNIQWQNTIGGNSWDQLYAIEQTTDGGYILGGLSSSGISGDKTEGSMGSTDYWVVKINSSGNIQWQNTIGGSNNDYLHCVSQTADGGYIIGGRSYSDASGDKAENNWDTTLQTTDYWILKLDSSGNIQWQNTIGGSGYEELWFVKQTTDGGYITGGNSSSDISGDKTENNLGSTDYWVIKLNPSGTIQWQNTIGGNGADELYTAEQTAEGGYILGGNSSSAISGDKTEGSMGSRDYWVVKLSAIGLIQWENTIGGASADYLHAARQTPDGGYFIGGDSQSPVSGDKTEICIGGSDYWVLKLDPLGNIEWQNTIGGTDMEQLFGMQPTADGGYVLGGFSKSGISGDKTENCLGDYDYWVVKLAADSVTGIIQNQNQNQISIYPNPANDEITISNFQFPVSKIEIINLLGEIVLRQTPSPSGRVGVGLLAPGLYIIKSYTDKGIFQQKLVIR